MNIEQGQIWATRDGRVATIDEHREDGGSFPYIGQVTGCIRTITWTPDGRVYSHDSPSDEDLVELIHPRPRKQGVSFEVDISGDVSLMLRRTVQLYKEVEVPLTYGMDSDEARELFDEALRRAVEVGTEDWDYVQDIEPAAWVAYTTDGGQVEGEEK